MKKNDILTGIVTSYGSEGEGIVKIDGYTIFLPFAIPGEKVRFKVLKVQKNIAFAKLEEVYTPADERVREKCPAFKKCGGCQLMHVEYSSQLKIKKELIENCFKKIAFINTAPSKTVASVPELHYRNKLQLPVRATEEGVKIGFFAINSHRVVDINNCLIHGEWCEKVITALRKYILDKGVTAYNEQTQKGLLRHIVVKKIGLSFIVILVINGTNAPAIEYFNELLKDALGGDYSLFYNVNKRNDNVILTDEFIRVFGNEFVQDSFLQIKYLVGPQSFMQVNESVKARLYSKVCDFIDPNESVIDAYCGAGLLSCLMARKAKDVIGVEIVQEAIDCAITTASENSLTNTRFICSPCENVLPDIVKKNPNATVVLDPPRKGLDKAVALAVKESMPKKIIYVSCSPQTLARDIGIITGTLVYEENNLKKQVESCVEYNDSTALNGYKIEYLCGYDMFAQCKGVETLCVLTRE